MKEKLPAVMHIHGGGQRAFLHEMKLLVERGYAALSVNWGGSGTGKPPFNACEKAEPGDPNTDWGAVDPSQLNVQGYSTMLPGSGQFYEDREHPKNNNWYVLNAGNATHQQFWTRKVTDPLWRGPDGSKLQITLKMPQTNRLHIVLQQNEWRSCRGQRWTYVCSREIEGADAQQTLTLDLSDFTSADGSPTSWAELNQLGVCAHIARRYEVSGPKVAGMGSNIASAVTRTGPVKARKSRCSLFLRIKSQVKQR